MLDGCTLRHEGKQKGRERLDECYGSDADIGRSRGDKHQQAGNRQQGYQRADAAYRESRFMVRQQNNKQANGNIPERLPVVKLTHMRLAIQYTVVRIG